MKKIRASDAFGLSLIKENPNREAQEVREILQNLEPDAQQIAHKILERADVAANIAVGSSLIH
jgi:hypothetical protein